MQQQVKYIDRPTQFTCSQHFQFFPDMRLGNKGRKPQQQGKGNKKQHAGSIYKIHGVRLTLAKIPIQTFMVR